MILWLIFVILITPYIAMAQAVDISAIELPAGFNITIVADRLDGARMMAFDENDNLFVTLTRQGRVVELKREEGGRFLKHTTILEGLNNPHGIAFFNGDLFIAETHRVVRFKKGEKGYISPLKIIDLPIDGEHFTRTIAFSQNGRLFISVGSSCNLCIEKDKRRASIISVNPDGSDPLIFAEGLRNTVGFRFHPLTGEIWGTDNGRDWFSDDLPSDELNLIEMDQNYGWPFCYDNNIPDPRYNNPSRCKKSILPFIKFQAHSAPLGMDFSNKTNFPEPYRDGLFVAFHGSWNRSERTGYKIVFIPFQDNRPVKIIKDFAIGWLRSGIIIGRPVDILQSNDGSIYVSDDRAGVIYRIAYTSERQGRNIYSFASER